MAWLNEVDQASVKRYQLRVTIAPFVTVGIAVSRHLAFAEGEMHDARAAAPLNDTVSFGFI